jgi:hypothetical protein
MTYAELVQKIRDYTEVGSEVLTSTIVNGFIRDAEFKIFREADADYAREYATSTFTANNKYLVLPNSSGSSGFPKYYATFRENAIEVAPTPSSNFVVELDYIYTPDGLSVTNTETYISVNAPELLLYACLVEAFAYLKGPMDMYKLYQEKYNMALQGFTLEQTGRRRRDEYQDGTLRIKVPSPSP